MLTNAVERRHVIRASSECSEVDKSRTLVGQGRDAHLAKYMQAVRRDSHSDLVEVVGPKARQLRIAQMIDTGKILGFML